jgi:hypothetical protein
VREEFNLETMTARTLDLYHDILPDLAGVSSDARSKMLALSRTRALAQVLSPD